MYRGHTSGSGLSPWEGVFMGPKSEIQGGFPRHLLHYEGLISHQKAGILPRRISASPTEKNSY